MEWGGGGAEREGKEKKGMERIGRVKDGIGRGKDGIGRGKDGIGRVKERIGI